MKKMSSIQKTVQLKRTRCLLITIVICLGFSFNIKAEDVNSGMLSVSAEQANISPAEIEKCKKSAMPILQALGVAETTKLKWGPCHFWKAGPRSDRPTLTFTLDLPFSPAVSFHFYTDMEKKEVISFIESYYKREYTEKIVVPKDEAIRKATEFLGNANISVGKYDFEISEVKLLDDSKPYSWKIMWAKRLLKYKGQNIYSSSNISVGVDAETGEVKGMAKMIFNLPPINDAKLKEEEIKTMVWSQLTEAQRKQWPVLHSIQLGSIDAEMNEKNHRKNEKYVWFLKYINPECQEAVWAHIFADAETGKILLIDAPL